MHSLLMNKRGKNNKKAAGGIESEKKGKNVSENERDEKKDTKRERMGERKEKNICIYKMLLYCRALFFMVSLL